MRNTIQFLIVDDHPIFIQGLSVLIESNPKYEVIDKVGTIEEALSSFEEKKPHIVLVDISLGRQNGLELVKAIKSMDNATPVLIISMHDELVFAERALKAGANGFIMKQEAAVVILDAIKIVLTGQVYISKNMNNRLLKSIFSQKEDQEVNLINKLSERELSVLEYIGQGYGASEISEILNLSVKTINTYRDHIKDKMQFDRSADVRRFAIKWYQSTYC